MELEEESAHAETPTLGPGTVVRVPVSPSQRELATVVAQDGDGSVLVRVEALWNSERVLAVSALQQPLEFESSPDGCEDAAEYKERGNLLFRLLDFTAALRQYTAGLNLLRRSLICSVGADVLHVLPTETRAGYVTDVNGAEEQQEMMLFEDPSHGSFASPTLTADVAYVEGEPEDSMGVSLAELLPRFDTSKLDTMYLYLSLLSNSARCLSKKSLPQEALECINAGIQILKCVISSEQISQRSVGEEAWSAFKTALSNAYILRGHIYIQMSKFSKAQADASVVLSRIDRNSQKARDLHIKCQRRAQQTERQNKRLARDVSRWVEEAMHGSGEETGAGGIGNEFAEPAYQQNRRAIDDAGSGDNSNAENAHPGDEECIIC